MHCHDLCVVQIGRTAEARTIAERLASKQHSDGSLLGSQTSITNSRGQPLDVEATSVAIIAWLHDDRFINPVRKAMEWLVRTASIAVTEEDSNARHGAPCDSHVLISFPRLPQVDNCKNGLFGTTQGTVLALKAIIAYDVKSSRPKAAGSLVLELDGEEVDRVAFTEHSEGALAFSASKVQCTAVQQTCRSCHTGETVSVVAFIAMYCRWSWRSSPRQRTVSTSEWSRLL